MKSLKTLYLQATRLPESEEYKKIAPVKVFDLVTGCSAVRAQSAALLNRAEKEAFADRENLICGLRDCLDTGEIPEAGEKYDSAQVHKVAALLLNSKAAGHETRIKPKLVLRQGFFTYLTGMMDLILRENDKLTLVRISQAKSAKTDETSVLLYILLALTAYPEEDTVIVKKISVVPGGAADEVYVLDREDLTEDPELTLKKLISSLAEEKRTRGQDCAECVHAPYCTVLKQEVEREALNAAE